MMKPIGRSCSSSRCAMRLAVRARIGTPLTASSGNPASSMTAAIAPETFIDERLARDLGQLLFDESRDRDVPARDAGLVRDREQPADAGVALLVQRVAVARNRAARLARLDERGERRRIDVAQRDVAEDARHEARGRFRRAEDHGAAAEEARRDRALDAPPAPRRASCAPPRPRARARARRSRPASRRGSGAAPASAACR